MSCPTLDLSVTWDSDDRNLLIYRPPDQTVSKIHQVAPPGHKAPEVQAVTWKPDGEPFLHPCRPFITSYSFYIFFIFSIMLTNLI